MVTFAELGDRYILPHQAGWRNPKQRQQWKNTLQTSVYPLIGKPAIQDIDTALALQVLQPVAGTTFWLATPETAGRVRGRCEQIWDAAQASKLLSGENPFSWKTLKHMLPAKTKVHTVVHHPAVPWPEMPALMGKLRARTSISARALEFTILTACRVSEVTEATGRTYYSKGDYDRAITDFDQAIGLEPKAASLYNFRGEAYDAKNDPDHAIADFAQG
jgi:tetratricopeptide (TPR) repeat protein